MSAPACATPDSNASSGAQGWGEAPGVQPAVAAAGPPGTARSHGRSNSEFTGPGSPYLDRDAERAYLTQIIKDDDLVSAFLARLLPLGVAIRRIQLGEGCGRGAL